MIEFINFDRLCKLINEFRQEKALITFHSTGDRDGVGSAIALSNCFDEAVVATPDFLTHNAKRMLEQSGYRKNIAKSFPKDLDIVVVTDCNNFEALGGMRQKLFSFSGKIIFIDHHLPKDYNTTRDVMVFNDEGYTSASSIVYELMKRNKEEISKQTALLLLNGIISDSADFQNSTPLTFMQVSELLAIAGTSYSAIVEYFHHDVPAEKRYALMRDLFSSKIEIVGEYILAYGSTSSNANLIAETAMHFGADLSLFWTVRSNEASFSARLRAPLEEKLGIHLGRVMEGLGKELGGNGGGHPCAAGAYGPNKKAVGRLSSELVDTLKEKFLEI